MVTEERQGSLCVCSDDACVAGHGDAQCNEDAGVDLVRISDPDQSRLTFCDTCAGDALESGDFSTAEPDVLGDEDGEEE